MSFKKLIVLVMLFVNILIFAEERNALLIANEEYSGLVNKNLKSPVSDAKKLEKSLLELGFKVDFVKNVSKKGMTDKLNNFQQKLKASGGVGFFYYNGHAVQLKGENYLIPSDAVIPNENKIFDNTINLRDVMSCMKADMNIVILDSCRDNPLPSSSRSVTRGLQPVQQKPKNSIIVYSAEPGSIAKEGVFTDILAKKILNDDDFGMVLQNVRKEVEIQTKGEQQTIDYDERIEEVYLARGIVEKLQEEYNRIEAELKHQLAITISKNSSVKDKQLAERETMRLRSEMDRKKIEKEKAQEKEDAWRKEQRQIAEEDAKKNEIQRLQEKEFTKTQEIYQAKLKEIEQLKVNSGNIEWDVETCNQIYRTITSIKNDFTVSKNKIIAETKAFYQKKRGAITRGKWDSDEEFAKRKANELKNIEQSEISEIEKIKNKYDNEITVNTAELNSKLKEMLLDKTVTVSGKRLKVTFNGYYRNQMCFPFTITDIQNPNISWSSKIDISMYSQEERNKKCAEIDDLISKNGYEGLFEYMIAFDKKNKVYVLKDKYCSLKKVSDNSIVASNKQQRQKEELQEKLEMELEKNLSTFVFVQGNYKVSDFFICDHELTQAEYMTVTGINPALLERNYNYPVRGVSWYDAIEFCNKLSEKEGLTPCYTGSGSRIVYNRQANGYRLPTEAEWVYAARGGNKSKDYKYSGSNKLTEVGWYILNSKYSIHPVKQKKPNELGIYDMNGNVEEWCWYDGYYYSGTTKGGSYWDYGYECALDDSGLSNPDVRYNSLGFRLVRSAGK